jgi:uncharacterized membrane protein
MICLFLAGSAVALLGCRRETRDPEPSAAHKVPIAEPAAGAKRLRGHMVISARSGSFTPCGSAEAVSVLDSTGGDLALIYRELVPEQDRPLYVEVLATAWQPPGGPGSRKGINDPGAARDGNLIVHGLRRAASESAGCAENLEGLEFRALGNEPFWKVDIADDGITFEALDAPQKLAFPYPSPDVSRGRITYRADAAVSAGEPARKIEVVILERRCRDSMSGALFSFQAEISLNGRRNTGCAAQGWP